MNENIKASGMSEKELFSFVEYHPEEAERIGYSNYSYWGSVMKNFFKKKSAVVMCCVFIVLFIFSFVAPNIGNFRLAELEPNNKEMFKRPDNTYWFGTDNLGQDYWVQVWSATQTSLKMAGIVAVCECLVGVVIGCFWGYVRQIDRALTELYNIMTNVPNVIYMTLIALMVGQSFFIMCVSLTAFGWMPMARQVRGLVMMYRDREYNLASRCLGTRLGTILAKNIFPYLVSVIVLRLALSIPRTIALETTLSYLGLGLDVNTPSLGILLRNARNYFVDFPYLLVFPAIIVSIVTITFYLVGNAFSDACAPRNHV